MLQLFCYIFLFIVCSIFTNGTLFASVSIDDTATLREIQESRNNLQEKKEELDSKWKSFFLGQEGIGSFMRELNIKEQEHIEFIIDRYQKDLSILHKTLDVNIQKGNNISGLRQELYILKNTFYKEIQVYVVDSRMKDFIKYKETDLAYRVKSNDVSVEIAKRDEQKQDRIEELQDSASQNAEQTIRYKFDEISKRVEFRLKEFTQSNDFSALSPSTKQAIFQKMIEKFRIVKEELKSKKYVTTIIEEKIILFENIIEILQSYIDLWKEEQ